MVRLVFSLLIFSLTLASTPALAQSSIDTRGNVGGSGVPGGSIIPGMDTDACIAGKAGAIRWNASTSCAEFCNGTAWVCPSSGGSCGGTETRIWKAHRLPANFNGGVIERPALSQDGSVIVVASHGNDTTGPLLVSNDGGNTWTVRDSNRRWYAVDASNDGSVLAAVVYGGQIYVSTNSGVSWTARDSNRNWGDIAVSADGTRMIAANRGGQLYTSTNTGATWTARDSNRNWRGVASSADGTILAATVDGGRIYTSTNSGASWTQRENNRSWRGIAMSANGTNMVATVEWTGAYSSSNTGVNWTARTNPSAAPALNATPPNMGPVVMSDDGNAVVTTASAYYLSYSENAGVNWNIPEYSPPWASGVGLSADGSVIATTEYWGDFVWLSKLACILE